MGKEIWDSRYLEDGLVWRKGAWALGGQIHLDLQTYYPLEKGAREEPRARGPVSQA